MFQYYPNFNPEHLKKTTSEMYVIYKYTRDPMLKVKSEIYTEDEFKMVKDLFPEKNLLQVSPLVGFDFSIQANPFIPQSH